ncbi:hypothetical protein FNF27_03144 [Cafeteria roenbergensis]|uniref:GPN-loop GTPase 3 n=1 Tax=Cafeteria roenbergensis TaxID=33653 RepID=A0A5A8D9R4_CAFRO|nr:hypothetical protein FNF29_06859 [Cafeteria roenbergensis]KAA0162283.1 hypothetical protein FNF31_03325 [Cafeteria roenbergensis]KAA0169758.1 hypothetical protein FNF28_01877 [Cafeteria roenbergensis]KAA0175444.1 hypothetical protein FNF27_03144 [Cafeteria roenbergensis]|eukprot:KAA0148200.1 hypothetical protein FNF29_06859 [Cafeteria roenbergensis]
MKYCQIVMGPAGTGKSTYCQTIQEHCAASGRSVHVINLDPAAEAFKYQIDADVRDLISVDEVMDELGMGPNGGLLYCMEYLAESIEWFQEILRNFGEDDYVLLDCPGQIELYSHIPVMRRVVDVLRSEGFNVAGVYTIDAMFVTDAAKLLSGNLAALSAMVHLELPHVNVLTKCDLVEEATYEPLLSASGEALARNLAKATGPRFRRLNGAIASLLDDYNMVSFVPLDPTTESSVDYALAVVDACMQYGEDMEPKEPKMDESDAFSGDAAAGAAAMADE